MPSVYQIGRVGRVRVAARSGTQPGDPQLLFHVLMILLSRPIAGSGVCAGGGGRLGGQSAGRQRHGDSEGDTGGHREIAA